MVFIPSKARPAYHRALLNRLLGRREDAAELCKTALQTADYSVAHLRAHQMLAELEFPGEDYFRVLARIHEHLKPATYVEIGIFQGESFEIVRPETLAVGVDPSPRIRKQLSANQRVFAETSDNFFENRDVRSELGGKPIDLAFIDGLHLFEFALRDFINIEKLCSPDSVILIHDVYPIDDTSAARERASWFWSGDIWRLILTLKKYRPDLSVNVIAARPTGLAIIQNLNPESRVLEERQNEITDEFLATDISVLDGRKAEMLNRFPNEWASISRLIDTRGRA
ncbi:class I SAM-dependent methyltransferase [Mycolicibacterium sp. Dal123E01]|uniref:class I SAM-dependent methyltransferase n=1 Tax=Mycolicibacterium sp. Dal123E01 TaxID=3457578 RepID=UPI00403EDF39